MKIVFVRHGESEANAADFINDDPGRPVNLTECGREQAESVAERLRPPLGENFLEQTQRLRSFLQAMESLPGNALVLAVSHEYPLRSILMLAGVEPEIAVRESIPNCGTVSVEYRAGSWLLVP